MKKYRKFKGYHGDRQTTYTLIKQSKSKSLLKRLAEKYASHRIIKCRKGWALYGYNRI